MSGQSDIHGSGPGPSSWTTTRPGPGPGTRKGQKGPEKGPEMDQNWPKLIRFKGALGSPPGRNRVRKGSNSGPKSLSGPLVDARVRGRYRGHWLLCGCGCLTTRTAPCAHSRSSLTAALHGHKGQIWSNMAKCGQIELNLVKLRLIWSKLAKLTRIDLLDQI